MYVNIGFYENWLRETITEFDKASFEEAVDVESAFNFAQSGRVLNDMSSGSSSGLINHHLTTTNNVDSNSNVNLNSNINNNDENDNFLLEPASIINERSNSQVINGTESDELTLPLSVTEAPKLINQTSSTTN